MAVVRRSEESTDPRSVASCAASDGGWGSSEGQPSVLRESAIRLSGSVGREKYARPTHPQSVKGRELAGDGVRSVDRSDDRSVSRPDYKSVRAGSVGIPQQ